MSGSLARVVRAQRLSTAETGEKKRFTVSRVEAVLAARARPRGPWDFTLSAIRAAGTWSDHAWVAVSTTTIDEHDVVTFDFGIPGDSGDLPGLTGLLLASLGQDPGRGGRTADAREMAWRRLVGAAVNAALAAQPQWVELSTPTSARRWTRATAAGVIDPYAEQATSETVDEGRFRLQIAEQRKGVSDNIRSWFVGRGDPLEELWTLWRESLVVDVDAGDGVVALERPEAPFLPLGSHGRWTPRADESALWLVRQGVRIVELTDVMSAVGLLAGSLRGWVEYPELVLDVDERTAVEDEAFTDLSAWLADIVRCELNELEEPQWPADVGSLSLASGGDLDVETYESNDSAELLYVWRTAHRQVPPDLTRNVVVLWPSELEAARKQRPQLKWIPLRVLGVAASAPRADLTPVASRAFAPHEITMEPATLSFVAPDGRRHEVTLRPRVEAFVHKYPGDTGGSVLLLAFGRRLTKISERDRVIPGMTIVASIEDDPESTLGISEMMSNLDSLRELADAVVDAAWPERDRLIGAAMGHLSGFDPAWHVPVVAAEVEEASPATIGLHYTEGPDSEAYLTWRSHAALLALDVGRTLEGQRRRLVDALYRARDVGGVVVGDTHRRWYTLESDKSEYETWVLHPSGRKLLEAVLGPGSLWEMPVVPERFARPIPAAEQPHVLLDAGDVARRMERMEPSDVLALQAHLLVARLTSEADHGLGAVRLFDRYDPRALAARTTVTLDALEQEAVWPLLVPVGGGGRWLSRTAVEVTASIAHLLDELRDCEMAPPAPTGRHRVSPGQRPVPRRPGPSVRRSGDTALATVQVADRLAIGALHVDPNHDSITLRARGLEVGSFRIPSPLRAVSGRLWLTDAGVRAGIGHVVGACIGRARELWDEANAGAQLSPPGSQRREALEVFLRGVRQSIAQGQDRIGLELHGSTVPRPAVGGPPSLRGRADGWLGQIVRYTLGRQIQLDSAWFSWRAARVADPAFPGRVELGRLDRWIRRAMSTEATGQDVLMAACLVVGEILAEAPDWVPLDVALERLLLAAGVMPP